MYNIDNVFLYEVLDDFKNAFVEDRYKICKDFCDALWSVPNQRQVYEKNIKYNISSSLPDGEIKDIFKKYTKTSCLTYKSKTSNTDSWHLLRQKVNNLYTTFCDSKICQKKEYFNELNTAKNLYFKWQRGELILTPDELEIEIQKSIVTSADLFVKYKKQKMDITWAKYKKLINGFMLKCFETYIPFDEFSKGKDIRDNDYWIEDNFIIKYIGKSLTGYMMNYEKSYYGICRLGSLDKRKYNRCKKCGNLFLVSSKNKKLCDECLIYTPVGEKTIICVDCGKEFQVDGNVKKQIRCSVCQQKKQLEWQRESMKKSRNKM